MPTPKKSTLTAGFLTAATLSFGAISPAHAAPVSCLTGGLGGENAYLISTLTGLGSAGCFIEDKVYSDFSFSGITSGIYTFTVDGVDHTFSGTGLNFTGNNFSYSYKVSLFNPKPGQAFLSFNTDAAGSATTSALVYSKSLSTDQPTVGTSTANQLNPGSIVPFVVLPPTVGPVVFSSSLTRTGGKIDQFTDTLSQKFPPGESVPGPLPLLGAGAAFGFSRRLRSRIKQVA